MGGLLFNRRDWPDFQPSSTEIEDLVLRRRKQLLEAGKDHGAQSIVWALQRDGIHSVPSPSTVWQILTRRGA
ncbi:IS481 family transposase, partial [Mycolicibacterium frederiksbergense]|nr:IS481 family transposase [Mycolicibacterium frederiksbergense]